MVWEIYLNGVLCLNIESIRLINFRNYGSLSVNLNKNMNIFIGKNAQGKTNLLEAIYICATGNSFRTNRDRELINFYKNEAYVGANVNFNGAKKLIEIKLDRNRQKRIKINKVELNNFKELNSGLNVVVFSPDDLKIIKDGPFERRNFLDSSISEIRPVYKYNLSKYNKILYQRNNLLKSNKPKSEILTLLEIFDLQLAKTGTEIILTRKDFLNKLSNEAESIHKKLTLENEKLTLDYISNVDFLDCTKNQIEENFLKKLKYGTKKDLITGNTETGPHRDDIGIKINGLDTRSFASQGQQRTIVLSIKLAQMEIIYIEKEVYPILLLDDVFSELDKERRKYLSKSLSKMQTIITSTDLLGLENLKDMEKSIFYIENRKIMHKE